MNPYLPMPMRVRRIIQESDDKTLRTFELVFVNRQDEQAFDFLPGQFCEVSLAGKGESPLGIASSPTEKGTVRFTVNRAGLVTTALHYMAEGDLLGMRGPLGNSYPIEQFKGQSVVIVAGGFAFTTLRSLAVYLLHPDHRKDVRDLTVVYGARRPGLLLYRDELAEWQNRDDLKLYLTIDTPAEGWEEKVGFVPTVTKEVAPSPERAWAVVCGPPIMIKFTLPVLLELGFPPERIYTSLERRMKCGIGKCGRCNIGPKYVCVDGPVFSYADLQKLPEAF